MVPRSFRARLTWFFIIIVVLPMVAIVVVLLRLVADSARGRSDARLSQAQVAAQGLFRDEQRRAAAAGRAIGQSPALAAAIESGDSERIAVHLNALAQAERAACVVLVLDDGVEHRTGAEHAVAPSTTMLVNRQGGPAGTLRVSVVTAQDFADAVLRVVHTHAVVVGPDGEQLATTLPGLDGARLPDRREETEHDGRRYRLAAFTAPAFEGMGKITVRLLADQRLAQSQANKDTMFIVALLAGFLILAFAFAAGVSRALQAQIQRLLTAARRLGSGDLTVEVPTEGNDEFAQLATEFNAMARQLESRHQELDGERARLQHAIRRVGESFAKGLDRRAVLEIVVQTVVDGVAASVGRASVREALGGPLTERARVGAEDGYGPILDAVEAIVLRKRDAAELHHGDKHALCHPLRPSDGGSKVLGLISVARARREFSGAERDLFHYLATQASVSIENVDLHERVQRQAVTDELTGLFNHRRFQEVMSTEVERARRFGQTLGLIMLDIDDFKTVNDRYGHLQGDQVLREVAKVLLESSREIDEPARYGGEEMAVALPQTDLEGAYLFAERVRRRIEELEIRVVNGSGTLRITASLGAAALPQSAGTDKDALVAAADSALYRAKRLGKNRVVKAG